MGRMQSMSLRKLIFGAAMLSAVLAVILGIVCCDGMRPDTEAVMSVDGSGPYIEALTDSINSIETIEYKQTIRSSALGGKGSTVLMHYYYRKPYYLYQETKSDSGTSVDIYTPSGMYELFPDSSIGYFREAWKGESHAVFGLVDVLRRMTLRGGYDPFKSEKLSGRDSEAIRSVDEDGGRTYEHRIWISNIDGFELPVKEEHMVDGEVVSSDEYQYISLNREIDNGIFGVKSADGLRIYNGEGIPKLVKDANAAKDYLKFNVSMPKYIPEGFSIDQIYVIPPAQTPSAQISITKDLDTIYLTEKKLLKSELSTGEGDRTVNSGGFRFAVRDVFNDSISIRWVKNGIEFEVSGLYTLKDGIIGIANSLTGASVTVE